MLKMSRQSKSRGAYRVREHDGEGDECPLHRPVLAARIPVPHHIEGNLGAGSAEAATQYAGFFKQRHKFSLKFENVTHGNTIYLVRTASIEAENVPSQESRF